MDFHDACVETAREFAEGERRCIDAFGWLRDDWPALFGALRDLERAVLPVGDPRDPT